MHNVFNKKGLEKYEQEIEDLAIALFGLFKVPPGRTQDYKELKVELVCQKNFALSIPKCAS